MFSRPALHTWGGAARPLAGISYRHGDQGRGELARRGSRRNARGQSHRVSLSKSLSTRAVSSSVTLALLPLGQLIAWRIGFKRSLTQPHSATLSLGFARGRAAGTRGWRLPRPSPRSPAPLLARGPTWRTSRGRPGRPARDLTSPRASGALRTWAAALSPASRCQAPARPAARRPRAGRG